MSLHDYQPWELKPFKLSQEERENPMKVIHDFFSFAHLPHVRELLWEWLKTTVTGNYNTKLTRRERANMVYFYEQLEKFIEAAHLLHQLET